MKEKLLELHESFKKDSPSVAVTMLVLLRFALIVVVFVKPAFFIFDYGITNFFSKRYIIELLFSIACSVIAFYLYIGLGDILKKLDVLYKDDGNSKNELLSWIIVLGGLVFVSWLAINFNYTQID